MWWLRSWPHHSTPLHSLCHVHCHSDQSINEYNLVGRNEYFLILVLALGFRKSRTMMSVAEGGEALKPHPPSPAQPCSELDCLFSFHNFLLLIKTNTGWTGEIPPHLPPLTVYLSVGRGNFPPWPVWGLIFGYNDNNNNVLFLIRSTRSFNLKLDQQSLKSRSFEPWTFYLRKCLGLHWRTSPFSFAKWEVRTL